MDLHNLCSYFYAGMLVIFTHNPYDRGRCFIPKEKVREKDAGSDRQMSML